MSRNIDLTSFQNKHILVIGDLMLDQYLWGNVKRISPEAPVPIFHIKRRSEVLGGAGNVLSNLHGLGCSMSIIGLIGKDENGKHLRELLNSVHASCYIFNNGSSTITKTRVISSGQQLIRLDDEQVFTLKSGLVSEILQMVKEKIHKVDAVIFSDYGKGIFQTRGLSQNIINMAREYDVPVIVDPKGKDWNRYAGATCITPNLNELEMVYEHHIDDDGDLVKAMKRVKNKYKIDLLLITRGDKGMCLLGNNNEPYFIPAQAREVYDVSGAGDTVIATFSAGIAARLDFEDAALIANIAAGIVVGKIGTQPIKINELQAAFSMNQEFQTARFLNKIVTLSSAKMMIQAWQADNERIVFTNGCFDLLHPGHIHLLHKAKELGNRLVVGLNSDNSIRKLKGPKRPILTEHDRASILGALDFVDLVIIFEEDTPLKLISEINPDVLVKGADYTLDAVVGRELVEANGGQVILVPLLENHSTTQLEERILENY